MHKVEIILILIAEIQKEAGNYFVNFLLAQAINMKSDIPVHFRDVLKIKERDNKVFSEWMNAMKEEIDALNHCDVWELVNCPKDCRPIKCRWV